MNTKFRILLAMGLALASAQSHAGRQGIHFLYGIGLSAAAPQVKTGIPSHDIAPVGEITAGIEEDGWAAEYTAMRSLDTGTETSSMDYNTSIKVLSLSYRTVERDNRYFKYKYGVMSQNFDYISTTSAPLTGDSAVRTSGNLYSFAMGFRMGQTERLEVEYGYYARKSEVSSTTPYLAGTHMLTLRYLFGGVPSDY